MLGPAFHRVVGREGTDFYGFVVIDEFVSGRGTGTWVDVARSSGVALRRDKVNAFKRALFNK